MSKEKKKVNVREMCHKLIKLWITTAYNFDAHYSNCTTCF